MPIYVINVFTGQESEIAVRIRNMNHPDIKKVHNPLSILKSPVFPGYLFIEMEFSSDAYYAVLNTPGVFCFLPKPVYPVGQREAETALSKDKSHIPVYGFQVEVSRGNYEGIVGVIENIKYPYARLRVELFGTETVINVRISNLILLQDVLKPEAPIIDNL